MARLPVVMIGAGHVHAPTYLAHLVARDDVEVVGVFDVDPATGRRQAQAAGVPVLASEEEGLKRARAVVICSEPTRQYRLIGPAADRGIPVLCEKPFGTNLSESRAMLALSERVPISVALPVRYHPASSQLRHLVGQGALGPTIAVWATNRNSFPGGWFADPQLAGGGCLLDHLVHVADLVRWIWGTEFDSVTAESGNLHIPGLGMEDTAIVLVACASGMIVTIDPSMSRPRGMPGALDLTMKVWGDRGAATLDIFADRVDSVDSTGGTSRHFAGYDFNAAMLEDWVTSVRQESTPPVSAKDGFAATCLSFAAQEAADNHQTFTFPFPD
jgi:predicted dehydrogenase